RRPRRDPKAGLAARLALRSGAAPPLAPPSDIEPGRERTGGLLLGRALGRPAGVRRMKRADEVAAALLSRQQERDGDEERELRPERNDHQNGQTRGELNHAIEEFERSRSVQAKTSR